MHTHYQDLKSIQHTILQGIALRNSFTTLATLAAFDLTFTNKKAICVGVVFTYPDFTILETKHTIIDETVPYSPHLLPFREGPPIIATYKTLEHQPDLLLIDGNGALHPTKMGVASYVGVLLNKPTIGIAKELIHGHLNEEKIIVQNEHRGTALKTKAFAKPIYISPGHAITLATSVEITQHCSKGYKLPYPLHVAHKHLLRLKKQEKEQAPEEKL